MTLDPTSPDLTVTHRTERTGAVVTTTPAYQAAASIARSGGVLHIHSAPGNGAASSAAAGVRAHGLLPYAIDCSRSGPDAVTAFFAEDMEASLARSEAAGAVLVLERFNESLPGLRSALRSFAEHPRISALIVTSAG